MRANALFPTLAAIFGILSTVDTQFTFKDSPECPRSSKCRTLDSCPEDRIVNRNKFCDFQGSEPLICCRVPLATSAPRPTTKTPTTTTPTTSTARSPATTTSIPGNTDALPADCGMTGLYFNRIVGGEVAQTGTWPWMCAVYVDGNMECGGSLISENWVLTAAHCVYDDNAATILATPSRLQVRLGVHNLSSAVPPRKTISKVLPHPSYKGTATYNNDLALLRLSQGVQFGPGLKAVCLPGRPEDAGDPSSQDMTGKMAQIAGWGRTLPGGDPSNILLQTQVPIWSDSSCLAFYQKVFPISNNSFCAGLKEGGKDSCQGDSGGPLVVPGLQGASSRFYEVGLVSFGVGCAQPGVPGGYTKLNHYWFWIVQQILSDRAR